VRFHAEHRFHGSKQAVMALLSDPDFYVGLDLPDVNHPSVLEHHDDVDEAIIRLRYEFVGNLDPMARRLIGSRHLAWIQEVRADRSAASGSLHFAAEIDSKRLHGAADFVVSTAGEGSARRLDGELVVAVPGIGRMAERRITPGLLRRLDIEAQALDAQLRRV
jgi:hypothetical protein